MTPQRLYVEIDRHYESFDLAVRIEARAEILVLFGPSGAGKTQTLDAIAGLMTPGTGEIRLDETVFFRRNRPGTEVFLPARRRRIGYVFQNYALFPHLTAIENVAYPLWRQPGAMARAGALLDRMHLSAEAARYPHQISGGQQQRVAIARALAAEPHLLLLDEPFSALDIAIRERLHDELRTLQHETQLPVLYVTHNLDDALAIGHRIAIMQSGRIAQIGTFESVLRNPASEAVLEILGMPNILRARMVEHTAETDRLDWDGIALQAPVEKAEASAAWFVRPGDIALTGATAGTCPTDNSIDGQIQSLRPRLNSCSVRVACSNGSMLEVSIPATLPPAEFHPGARVRLTFSKQALRRVGGR